MCDLCNLEKKSDWYYEDEEFIICDCVSCMIPMIVSKEHADEVTRFTESYIYGLVKGFFEGKKFHFRKEARKIKDHWHWHIILEEES